MPTRKRTRNSSMAIAAVEDEINYGLPSLAHILPLVLACDGDFLDINAKRYLRLTCKALRELINPYLTKVTMDFDTITFFRRSTWALGAHEISCEEPINRNQLKKISHVSFPNLQKIKLEVTSEALDLLPRRNWPSLKHLELNVWWDFEHHQHLKFRSFSHAKWPHLENLSLDIVHDDDVLYNLDDEDEAPEPDVGSAACLLSFFPKLRSLEITTFLTQRDMQAFASIYHEKLEKIVLNFQDIDEDSAAVAGALASARWPRLQELTARSIGHLCKDGAAALTSGTWIHTLKVLRLEQCTLCGAGAIQLINGLKGGVLEVLEIESTSAKALVAFKNAIFPKLKSLTISLLRPGPNEDTPSGPNEALAAVFESDLPCLEQLVAFYSPYSAGYPYSYYYSRQNWDTAPVVESAASVLPMLRTLRLGGMVVKKDCCAFIASVLLPRSCEIDLNRCNVESGVDINAIDMMLQEYNLTKNDLDGELEALGLMNKVYWYNMLSMDELRQVAISVFLETLGQEIGTVIEPAREALKAAADSSDERLRQRYQQACAAIRNLAATLSAVAVGEEAAGPTGSKTRPQTRGKRHN